jgi:hypothetical protein
MNLRELVRSPDLPAPDGLIPGWMVRVMLAIVGVLVTLLTYGPGGWSVVGILLSLAAAWAPQNLITWVLIVFLALRELGHHAALTWHLLVLLAGLHLLHVLGMLALELPWRSWVQPAVFARPLARFVAIQIPTQLLAVVALLLLAPNAHGHRPLTLAEFTVVGAAGLAGLALLLLRAGPDERQDR